MTGQDIIDFIIRNDLIHAVVEEDVVIFVWSGAAADQLDAFLNEFRPA